jgi:hypothetical protein
MTDIIGFPIKAFFILLSFDDDTDKTKRSVNSPFDR